MPRQSSGISSTAVGKRERGSKPPQWESRGIWGASLRREVWGGCLPGVTERSRRAGRVLAPPCQRGSLSPLLQGGIYPWGVLRAAGCARCTCSRVPVGRQRAPTDICQA